MTDTLALYHTHDPYEKAFPKGVEGSALRINDRFLVRPHDFIHRSHHQWPDHR